MAIRKVMLGFDEELLAEIEAYAAKMHINRTAAVTVLCSTALQAQKGMNTLDELVKLYKAEKAAQDGSVNDGNVNVVGEFE